MVVRYSRLLGLSHRDSSIVAGTLLPVSPVTLGRFQASLGIAMANHSRFGRSMCIHHSPIFPGFRNMVVEKAGERLTPGGAYGGMERELLGFRVWSACLGGREVRLYSVELWF